MHITPSPAGRLVQCEYDRCKSPAAGGAHTVRLETNRVLAEAIALYRSTGYQEVEQFNDESYADHWFAKGV